jgi:hypothetical protein
MMATDTFTKLERDFVEEFNPNTLDEIAEAAHLRADLLEKAGLGEGEACRVLRAMADAIDDFDSTIEL